MSSSSSSQEQDEIYNPPVPPAEISPQPYQQQQQQQQQYHPGDDNDDEEGQSDIYLGTPPTAPPLHMDVPLDDEEEEEGEGKGGRGGASKGDAGVGFDTHPLHLVHHHYHKFSLPLKIHIAIALVGCMITLFVWHWTAKDDEGDYHPSDTFWWWIYPFFFFALSLTAHYYFAQKKWWRGSTAIVAILNAAAFCTWAFLLPWHPDEKPWFLFPWAASLVLMFMGYWWLFKREDKEWILFHLFWQFNLFLFLVWLFWGQGHPWFIYPLFVVSCPPLFFRLRYNWGEERVWVYLLAFLFLFNALLFFAWEFSASGFPWFFIPLGLSAVVIGVAFWRKWTWPGATTTSSSAARQGSRQDLYSGETDDTLYPDIGSV